MAKKYLYVYQTYQPNNPPKGVTVLEIDVDNNSIGIYDNKKPVAAIPVQPVTTNNFEDINVPVKLSELENDSNFITLDFANETYMLKGDAELQSFLKDISYNPSTKNLTFVFKLADETLSQQNIDISDLVDTYTAGNNISIENNVISFTGTIPDVSNFITIADVTNQLSGYATKEELAEKIIPTKVSELQNDSNFLTEHQSLSAYATKEQVEQIVIPTKVSELQNDLGFLNEHQSLSAYATKEQVEQIIIPTKVSELQNDSNFLTEHQSLEDYATKDQITNLISQQLDPKFAQVSGLFALKEELPVKVSELQNDNGYLTEHQDITGKVDKEEGKSLIAVSQIQRLSNIDNYNDSEVRELIATKANISGVYSKEEADQKFLTEHQSLEDYATKEDIINMLTKEADPIFSNALSGLVLKTNEIFGTFPQSGYTVTGSSPNKNYTANGDFINISSDVLTISGDSFRNNNKDITTTITKLTNHSLEITGDATIKSSAIDQPVSENMLAYNLFTVNIGPLNTVSGMAAMAIGGQNKTKGHYSFAQGYKTQALAAGSHAEGGTNYAKAGYSHTEGQNTETNAQYSHAEGYRAKTYATHSHAEGGTYTHNGVEYHPEAYGEKSHVEGGGNKTYGKWSHAEGCMTAASGDLSHTEGYFTETIAKYSHAEGGNTKTYAMWSHAEGNSAITSGQYSHAEGENTKAIGENSHAEGYGTISYNKGSHAEGDSTKSKGQYAHAEGYGTETSENYQHVEGKLNIPLTGYQHIVGGGTIGNKKNIQTLDWNGNEWNAGTVTASDFLFTNDNQTLQAKLLAMEERIAQLEAIISGLTQQ